MLFCCFVVLWWYLNLNYCLNSWQLLYLVKCTMVKPSEEKMKKDLINQSLSEFMSLQYEQIMIVHYDDLDFKYQLKILTHVLAHALVKHKLH